MTTTQTLPVYEQIETIVLSALRCPHSVVSGAYGSAVRNEDGSFAVTTQNGCEFTVKSTAVGWSVSNGNAEGLDRDLLEAARLAVEGI